MMNEQFMRMLMGGKDFMDQMKERLKNNAIEDAKNYPKAPNGFESLVTTELLNDLANLHMQATVLKFKLLEHADKCIEAWDSDDVHTHMSMYQLLKLLVKFQEVLPITEICTNIHLLDVEVISELALEEKKSIKEFISQEIHNMARDSF